ncbi:hypothetical protein [Pectinatus frisingensis]|uniref:hypothetical protein n=1 Tax=Pectinatus frisingensis TaxID=865 RepID=UPI003D8063CC
MKISADDLLDIMAIASNRIHRALKNAYSTGHLKEYLEKIDMIDLYPSEKSTSWDDSLPDGKIIIFGESAVKEREIYASLQSVGISKERIELHLGYEEAKTYQFTKLQYNASYRIILVGPMPHSTTDKGEFSSTISMMEQTDGFTKVIRMNSNGELKITKSNLKIVVQQEIDNGYLTA